MYKEIKLVMEYERKKYELQWKSVHPYFTEMKPEEFYALEFP